MADELSPSQAAARIGTTTRSVQRWIASGDCRRGASADDGVSRLTRLTRSRPAAGPGRRRSTPDPERLFIANRGEIAGRITRTCDRLGIRAIVPDDGRPRRARPARHRRGRRRGPRRPAPTPSTRASGSSPRTPTSPRRSIAAGHPLGRPAAGGDPGDGRQGRRPPARRRRSASRSLAGYDDADQSDAALLAAADADRLSRSSSSRRPAAAARGCGPSATPDRARRRARRGPARGARARSATTG